MHDNSEGARMNTESGNIAAHLATAKRLAADAVGKLREEDPEAFAAVNDAARKGAAFRVTAAFSVAGLCEVDVVLVMPDGEPVLIAHVEFEGPEGLH
jgi:hypothetical protein